MKLERRSGQRTTIDTGVFGYQDPSELDRVDSALSVFGVQLPAAAVVQGFSKFRVDYTAVP